MRNPESTLYRSGDRVVVKRRRRGELHGEVKSVANPRDNRSRYWVRLDIGILVFVTSNTKLCRENPLESLAQTYVEGK